MFEVAGIPIIASELDILYELKRQVLEKTGREILHKIKQTGDNIMICCPSHKDGMEKKPSCGITTIRKGDKPPGTVHCFACGYVDSLEGMVSKCFGYEGTSYGTTWLLQNFVTGDSETRPNITVSLSRDKQPTVKTSYITEEELASYRFYHPYMYQRKLTNEIIEKYDVGYQKDFVFDDNWKPTEVLTFPVRDINGNCLFVSRRSIYGKTFFLPKIEKPVYGIYELPKNCTEIVICESVINALTCVVYGRSAVALFGTGDENQYKVLRNLPIRRYVLGLDPDKAGNLGTLKLNKALRGKLVTKLVLPKDKDINDLTREEFWALPEIFVKNS